MKNSSGPRLQVLLEETGEGNVFKEIKITRHGNDVTQYKIKMSASSVLDPET